MTKKENFKNMNALYKALEGKLIFDGHGLLKIQGPCSELVIRQDYEQLTTMKLVYGYKVFIYQINKRGGLSKIKSLNCLSPEDCIKYIKDEYEKNTFVF